MTGKTVTARVTHRFTAAPERVFDAWLDPEKIRAWMRMALQDFGLSGDIRRVEVEPCVGGRFTFSDMRPEGEAGHWGAYHVLDRPRKLVFTWFTSEEEEKRGVSTVTITIEPDGQGSLLTLVHEMDAIWAEYEEQVIGGWTGMLEAQARLFEGEAR